MKRIRLALLCLLLLMSLAPWAYAGQVNLKILYVNDFHGFAEPHKPPGSQEPLGGIAYLAGVMDRNRQHQPSLLLAAGDMIQGHPWADFFEGRSSIDVMNAMKFDAMTVGNHEFYLGPKVLKERIAQANFPLLGANVEGLPGLKPYVIKRLQAVRIAIMGVVTQDSLATKSGNIPELRITTPESAVRKYLPELKRQADIIVVLSHCGYPADRRMAARVPGIDVIVGGHTHTKIPSPERVGQTIIVQAGDHAKALGVLDLKIKDGKIVGYQGELEEISPNTGKPDPLIQAIVARYARQAQDRLHQVIGETAVDLDGKNVKSGETNLGNFITDVMRQKAGADVAIINGGSIKTGIPRGKIAVKDVYGVLPNSNYLVTIRLSGAQLKAALENGVAKLEKPDSRFPQVSGLTFSYSRGSPAGDRVEDLKVGDRPVDPRKDYVVTTTDYLAAGGDGYRVFSETLKPAGSYNCLGDVVKGGALVHVGLGSLVRDQVVDAIQGRKTIAPGVEGRINAVD